MNLVYKNFVELTHEEHLSILKIRNSDYVRFNMKTDRTIQINEHLQWIDKLKKDKLNIYYAVINENIIVGAIYITDIDFKKKESTWGLYFKEKTNPLISSVSAYILIDRVFNFYDLERLNLEVNKKNNAAYKFDLTLGFAIYDKKKEETEEYYLMYILKNTWNNISNNNLITLLKKKISKINYTFKYEENKMKNIIKATYLEVLEQTGSELLVPELTDDVILLESGLDSLGFAILVAALEEELEFDPFTMMDEPVYPSTFGEFVAIYEKMNPNT